MWISLERAEINLYLNSSKAAELYELRLR